MSSAAIRVAVVGGGISGLAAALSLTREAVRREIALELTFLEAAGRLGGKICTERRDGFLIERGPDSFAVNAPGVRSLLDSVGLEREIVPGAAAPTLVYTGRALHPLPVGVFLGVPTQILPLVKTPLLSLSGKMEALADLISRYPGGTVADESVESFLARRFGEEYVRHVAAPLLEAIHADTVACMSAEAALPGFGALAASQGSVIRMLGRKRSQQIKAKRAANALSKAQTRPLASLRSGMGSVVQAMVRELPRGVPRVDSPVDRIERQDTTYLLRIRGRAAPVLADAVVLATPAAASGQLLQMPFEFGALDSRGPATVASVALAFAATALPRDLACNGFVVAAGVHCAISAATLVHLKWPHAVPAGRALIRCSVDFARAPAYAALDDTRLAAVVRSDLERILAIKAQPEFALVTRWPEAMPRYEVGHFGRLAVLSARVAERYPGVFLAGASFGGAGVASCIGQGVAAATAAFAHALKAVPRAAAPIAPTGVARGAVQAIHFDADATSAEQSGETEPC